MELSRNLILTSPLMKGDDVEELQKLLKANGWYKGEIDGEYGKLNAAAVYRGKYKIGYLRPNRIAGPAFWKHLTGQAEPTRSMKLITAKRRRDAAKRVNKRHELVKCELKRVNKTFERPPGSNNVPGVTDTYGRMIGLKNFIGAWCAMVISVCARAVGLNFVYAYCPYIVADAIRGRNGLVLLPRSLVSAVTGTLAVYDWQMSHRSEADHIGTVIEERHLKAWAPAIYKQAVAQFGPLQRGEFWNIEGNTSVGNDSNGGSQMVRPRTLAPVEAFVQVAG